MGGWIIENRKNKINVLVLVLLLGLCRCLRKARYGAELVLYSTVLYCTVSEKRLLIVIHPSLGTIGWLQGRRRGTGHRYTSAEM